VIPNSAQTEDLAAPLITASSVKVTACKRSGGNVREHSFEANPPPEWIGVIPIQTLQPSQLVLSFFCVILLLTAYLLFIFFAAT
jgi:hypothetical protein